eukprot:2246256-Lingulodinium_polyedra.AAC.1
MPERLHHQKASLLGHGLLRSHNGVVSIEGLQPEVGEVDLEPPPFQVVPCLQGCQDLLQDRAPKLT